MKRGYQILTAIAMFCTLNTALAQNAHYGDAHRAEASSRKLTRELHEPTPRLGFLDTTVATKQQFLDNLEVGLTLPGFSRNKIISYKVLYMPHLADERVTDRIKGARLPQEIFNSLNISQIKTGDVIEFEDIRIENNDRIYTVASPVRVQIL